MKALNQKGRSPTVINMTQTDWNEALNRPSTTISIVALMLGLWVILLSIVNLVEGAYSPGYKVSWIGFMGFGGEAFAKNDTGFVLDDAIFAIIGLLLIVAGDYGLRKANVDSAGNTNGAMSWILDIPNSDFMKNLVKGETMRDMLASWLVVIGILFYIIWSMQNNTWVDPGVYSVMISMVAFGFALNLSSNIEN